MSIDESGLFSAHKSKYLRSGKIKTAGMLFFLSLCAKAPVFGWQWEMTVLPAAFIRYRGEGSILPQSYINRFSGATSPVYRLELRQSASPHGYWGVSWWHAGLFGGGKFAVENIPDNSTGGTYQTNYLNVGFDNFFLTYHRPLSKLPIEMLIQFSVVREIFTRNRFVVQGVASDTDDRSEISAEGIGFGLTGQHGGRSYMRWQAIGNSYVQITDCNTDCFAGQIFQAEGGVGRRLWRGLGLEAGGFWQYWFMLTPGRKVSIPQTEGAVVSWERNETRVGGLYCKLFYNFSWEPKDK